MRYAATDRTRFWLVPRCSRCERNCSRSFSRGTTRCRLRAADCSKMLSIILAYPNLTKLLRYADAWASTWTPARQHPNYADAAHYLKSMTCPERVLNARFFFVRSRVCHHTRASHQCSANHIALLIRVLAH